MDPKTELLNDINHTLTYLKLEYHSETGLEFINLGRGLKYLKQLANKTKKFIDLNKKENEKLHLKVFDKQKYPLYELVKDTNFLELKDVAIYKPIGLSSTFLELVTLFDKYQDTGIRLDETHLKPFNVWLITLISNPDDLSKLTSKDILRFNKSQDIIDEFAKCFKGKDGLDSGRYGELLKRNKDWDEIENLTGTLTELAASKNMKTINESLDNAVTLVNDLIENIQTNTTIDVSKVVLKELSESIYNLAQLSNISSLYLTKLTATVQALEDNHSRLQECLDK